MTALLDAVGRSVAEAGERLSLMKEEDRPGLVLFVIVTDGGENCSHEYTNSMVKEMIEQQQNEYSWQFMFLGANQDAFTEAAKIGIKSSHTAGYDVSNTSKVYGTVSAHASNMRSASLTGGSIDMSFTQKERDEIA
jgi:hypothetical protein